MKRYKVNNFGDGALEPEELLLEAVSPDSRIERPIKSGFFIVFYFLISLIFIIFAAAGFNLGVLKKDYFSELSMKNKFISIPVFPERGLIYSRQGDILAENKKTISLWFLPSKLSTNLADKEALIFKISEILNVPADSLENLIKENSGQASILVSEDISQDQKEKIISLNSFSLALAEDNIRVYTDGEVFSHLIGYVSFVNEDDLIKDNFYKINDKIGRFGLENYYEKALRGQTGGILISRFKDEVESSPAQKGNNLVLNIDAELQKNIYSELFRALRDIGSRSGVAVALDPRDGRILSLVSLPSYDNNSFIKGLSQEEYKLLFESRKEPLLNRVISGRFAPGSTIKPLIALAALEEKVISPAKKINAPGFITIPNPYDPEIVYSFRDWRDHGWVDMREAIANSSDIYFYTVGGGYYDVKGLGIERIAKYFKMFKIDSLLGIDLNGEVAGFIPTPEWKKQYRDEIWYQGDTFNVSIGQGDLLVTPLWLTAFIGSIAENGVLRRPLIVDKVLSEKEEVIKSFESEILGQINLSAESFEVVKEGMKMAAENGTAKVLADLPFEVGAKSGTAEVIKGQSTNSWISVFAPYDNPQIVLTVMMESGKEGSYIPHQIAYRVLEEYFRK